jgi:hypothetical protein
MKKTGLIIFIFLMLWTGLAAAAGITVVTESLPPWQTTDGKGVGGIATKGVEAAIYIPEMSVDFEMAFNRQTPDSLVQKVRDGLDEIKVNGLYHDIMKWHQIPERLKE